MNKTYSIDFIDKDGINIKFNLKHISINELKCIYFKLSFNILSNIHDGRILSLTKLLNEKQLLNYTIPANEVINELKIKYMLNDWLVEIRTVFNKVKIILVIPDIKDNVDLLVDDMNKFGYYLSYYSDINHINSEYLFLYLYFEPNYTDDVTNRVKRHGVILHLTPGYNLENILKDHKLIPKFGDRKMKYPDRIYFINGDLYEKYILQLAKDLNSESSQKTNEYLDLSENTVVNTLYTPEEEKQIMEKAKEKHIEYNYMTGMSGIEASKVWVS